MFQELMVNGVMLPRPDDDIKIQNEKSKTEYETEAGTTLVSVLRLSKLTITGSWTITGKWLEKFRAWADADTVSVGCFYPSKDEFTEHECQLSIESEKHVRYARDLLHTEGLYEVSIKMEEL